MTEKPLLTRRLTAGDVAAAIALEQDSPGAWSEEALAAELHRPGGWQYVGHFQGKSNPICYACGHVVDQEAELYRIAVAADRRRQGLGTFFLRSLLRLLAKNGVSSCWLEVRSSNSAAVCLYHKLGFTIKAVRKKYYTDPPEDAIIMQWIAKTS
ncbi:MAG: ribosomal protein S18-alanine N-acetyltransferase [Deltaproteobacteria bacterium]